MSFIISCMAIAVKSVLGGFFIALALILLGLVAYGFNYLRSYAKEAIESKYDSDFTDKEE